MQSYIIIQSYAKIKKKTGLEFVAHLHKLCPNKQRTISTTLCSYKQQQGHLKHNDLLYIARHYAVMSVLLISFISC